MSAADSERASLNRGLRENQKELHIYLFGYVTLGLR